MDAATLRSSSFVSGDSTKMTSRARLGVGLASGDRLGKAHRRSRVRAGDDERVRILPAVTRPAFRRWTISGMETTLRPGSWPHFFGLAWSSSLNGARSSGFKLPNGATHVEKTAIADVGVGDEGRCGDCSDRSNAVGHLGQRDQTRRPASRSSTRLARSLSGRAPRSRPVRR